MLVGQVAVGGGVDQRELSIFPALMVNFVKCWLLYESLRVSQSAFLLCSFRCKGVRTWS